LKRGDLIFYANGERVTSASRLCDIFKSAIEAVKIEGINSELQPFALFVRRKDRPWLHSDFGLRVTAPAPENTLPLHPDSARSVIRNEISAFSQFWNHSRLGTESLVQPAVSGGANIVLAAYTPYLVLQGAIVLVGLMFAGMRFLPWLIPLTLLLRPGYRWWGIPALACAPLLNRFGSRQTVFLIWVVFMVWQLWSVEEAAAWALVLQVAESKNTALEWMV
jgi:hypothetical protein